MSNGVVNISICLLSLAYYTEGPNQQLPYLMCHVDNGE